MLKNLNFNTVNSNSEELKISSINIQKFDISSLKFFLTDSYLIESCYESYEELMKFLCNFKINGKFNNHEKILIIYNNGDLFFFKNNFNMINSLIYKYVDLIIMNDGELNVLLDKYKEMMGENYIKKDLKEFFISLISENLFLKFINFFQDNKSKELENEELKSKVIIVTRGSEDTWLIKYDSTKKSIKFFSSKPLIIPNEEIVDFNGAGDSFTAGFLCCYYLFNELYNRDDKFNSKELSEELENYFYNSCLDFGNIVAGKVIKYKGFQIPNNQDNNDLLKKLNNLIFSFKEKVNSNNS